MGDDIVSMKPLPPDDEAYLTIEYPKKTGRRELLHSPISLSFRPCYGIFKLNIVWIHIDAVMDGHGTAVHFSFKPMRFGTSDLETTDLLDRYRAYAEENICIK